ncbi:S-adenosyl-L-methionine-dependent methyltransferase [Lojkania enalia]|uniref:Sterol 24-C-methyltransferase n=1 Tax=Lojkania enalia TaxID=147567 RepID=A0A9P4N0D0_9PLEO|nr:S-adenosyl-L-methionine-dependent methyltransferase [Didymosphaeria enalia]
MAKGKRPLADFAAYNKHWANPSNDPLDIEGHERRREHYDQSIHFCRYPFGPEPQPSAMARQEHYMAHRLRLEAEMTVLDVGCGFGGLAREIAKFADCKVVGLNIHAYQVEKAKEFAQKQNIGEDVFEIVRKIPFPDNSFDAVYAIEATVHSPSLVAVYSEVFRVLKPGGRFGVYEWVMMDPAFDSDNMHHIALRNGIERGNGIPSLRKSGEATDAMRKAGFDLEPWWYFCAGDTKYSQGVTDWARIARMTRLGRVVFDLLLRSLELCRVVRKGTAAMAKEMIHGGDCIAEAGRNGLFTPMFLMIGLKKNSDG